MLTRYIIEYIPQNNVNDVDGPGVIATLGARKTLNVDPLASKVFFGT